jgi:DNA polymerase III subunit epsilon
MRQIFLDTETTGLSPKQGHRIVEIAAIEVIDGAITQNHIHFYINPVREIDVAAEAVHGLSLVFLKDKPIFADVANDIISFINGTELIIHNAPFDIGFLNAEFKLLGLSPVEEIINKVTDTFKLAKQLRPRQRNSLDALCQHFGVDNSKRNFHGAILDTQLLAEVYMKMMLE